MRIMWSKSTKRRRRATSQRHELVRAAIIDCFGSRSLALAVISLHFKLTVHHLCIIKEHLHVWCKGRHFWNKQFRFNPAGLQAAGERWLSERSAQNVLYVQENKKNTMSNLGTLNFSGFPSWLAAFSICRLPFLPPSPQRHVNYIT